jgi:hypothetical protein
LTVKFEEAPCLGSWARRLQRESQKAKASFFWQSQPREALLPKDLELEDASSVIDENFSTAANPSEEFIEEISGLEWSGVVDTRGIVADLEEVDYGGEDVNIFRK